MNHHFARAADRPQRIGAVHMRGMSMIEVLVSVLVLAVGLLGVAAMQSLAMRGGQGSLERSQAVMQSYAITEAMRANRGDAGSYNTAGMVCSIPSGGSLAQNDLREWITSLKTTIGSGAGDSTTCGQVVGCPDDCQITVQWDDTRAGGGSTDSLVTRTRI